MTEKKTCCHGDGCHGDGCHGDGYSVGKVYHDHGLFSLQSVWYTLDHVSMPTQCVYSYPRQEVVYLWLCFHAYTVYLQLPPGKKWPLLFVSSSGMKSYPTGFLLPLASWAKTDENLVGLRNDPLNENLFFIPLTKWTCNRDKMEWKRDTSRQQKCANMTVKYQQTIFQPPFFPSFSLFVHQTALSLLSTHTCTHTHTHKSHYTIFVYMYKKIAFHDRTRLE